MSVVYKCKECGGEIELQENGLGKCLYCGAVQTLPKEKDDKIQNLLNRANDFRLNCDFDRAIFEYEEVLKLSESEPEAHWGLFLSKYGVEYVKDNMTFTYKPTLHRISSISVFDDVDYQATIKYADSISAIQYKRDAENIESVMKELLLLSANQEPYDVFLSYKEADDTTRQRTDDSYLAHDLYNELTAQGYKVFFAPKSLGVGLYEPKIYSAIISSKVMIVLGTQPKYFDAVWVKNEWSRFAELIDNGEQKVLVPVFKNMDAGQLPNRLARYQALDMSNISFLQTLTEIISKSVNRQSRVNFNKDSSAEDAYLERGFLAVEDGNFSQADSFFENVLNLNPHNSQAYFGKLMVEMRITKQEQILTSPKYLNEYSNFEKAVRFADQQLKTTLLQYENKVEDTINEQKYNKAMAIISGNPIESDFTKASEIFQSLNGFKDAKEKEKFCLEKIEEIKKDTIWQKGINEENSSSRNNFKEKYQKAIEFYKLIPGWKDADERLVRCEKKIEEFILAEKKTIEKKNKKKRKIKFFISIILLFLVISIITGFLMYPKINFDMEDKVLLKSDGTLIATGYYASDNCDVRGWTDIIDVAIGGNNAIIGLKKDGTVISAGYDISSDCDVEDWTAIVAISTGAYHTVGLKADGTVVATGSNDDGQCDINNWTDIVAISAGAYHTVGLKSDGTVVAVGRNDDGINNWTDIVAISAGYYTIGLKSDGTVLSTDDDLSKWTDVVFISAGSNTVGLKSDGTILYIGWNSFGKVKYTSCEKYKDEDIVSIFMG